MKIKEGKELKGNNEDGKRDKEVQEENEEDERTPTRKNG